MFDTKLDGKIKKVDLKRVLENFAFHISKDQFDRYVIITLVFTTCINIYPL